VQLYIGARLGRVNRAVEWGLEGWGVGIELGSGNGPGSGNG
jgi:hypothetical protein